MSRLRPPCRIYVQHAHIYLAYIAQRPAESVWRGDWDLPRTRLQAVVAHGMHGSENTAPGAQLHAQLQGLSLAAGGAANPTHAGTPAAASASSVAYPPVPRPAAAQPMYPPPTGGAAAAAAAAAEAAAPPVAA